MSHSTSQPSGSGSGTTSGTPRRAGAFDIRTFIGSLVGIYGIVLVLVGIFGNSAQQKAKSDDVNVNLWTGIVMVVVSLLFFAWARWRPVVVPDDPEAFERDDDRPAH